MGEGLQAGGATPGRVDGLEDTKISLGDIKVEGSSQHRGLKGGVQKGFK